MLEYWGDQLEILIKLRFLEFLESCNEFSDNNEVRKFKNNKEAEMQQFLSLTKRFSTLGTKSETVKNYFTDIYNNDQSRYYKDPTFLSILVSGGKIFEIPPALQKKAQEKNSIKPLAGIQLKLEDYIES